MFKYLFVVSLLVCFDLTLEVEIQIGLVGITLFFYSFVKPNQHKLTTKQMHLNTIESNTIIFSKTK